MILFNNLSGSMRYKIITFALIIFMAAILAGVGFAIVKKSAPKQQMPAETLVQNTIDFDTPLSLAVGQHAIFPDGLELDLVKIDDSRCKPGTVCIWAGELAPEFHVTYGNEGIQPIEMKLGTTTAPIHTKNGYVTILNNATETAAFVTVSKTISQPACYVGGCSSEVCSEQSGVISSCAYNAAFACYKTAACERQASGKCGWTPSSALNTCLSNPG